MPRNIVILFFALIALSTFSPRAFALKCAEESFEDKVQRAPTVFIGEVVSIAPARKTPDVSRNSVRYQIRITRMLKRDPKRPLKQGSLFWVQPHFFRNNLNGKIGKLYLFFNTSWLCRWPIPIR
ncbi:hypothetical protein L6R29_00785 [Myxococcota bacterium]|nr:hypothetical protein [Myxococcota bacterium]